MASDVHQLHIRRQVGCTRKSMDRVQIVYKPSGMVRRTVRPLPKRRRRLTYIRAWREHRHLTLEQLADRIGITHASLSRIERGLQDYTQKHLEALAEALDTDAASLLMRNPGDPEAIWSVWDQAKQAQRPQLIEVLKTLIKTGS
jgi:transcriptional regulator with XRE-family HTH domain